MSSKIGLHISPSYGQKSSVLFLRRGVSSYVVRCLESRLSASHHLRSHINTSRDSIPTLYLFPVADQYGGGDRKQMEQPFHVTCRVDLTPFIATWPRSKYALPRQRSGVDSTRPCASDVCDATKGNAKRGRDPSPRRYWPFVYVILSHSGRPQPDWIRNVLTTERSLTTVRKLRNLLL